MRRVVWWVLFALSGLVSAGSASGSGNVLSAAQSPLFARQGQAVSVLTVRPPASVATTPMRWAHEQPPTRRLAATRYEGGRAVVGVEPGVESVDLGQGIAIISFDRSLSAAEVSGPPSALAALESRVTSNGPLRYVEPLEKQTEQHQRSDPATYTVDPTTGAPYEWAFSHVGLDRALNLTQGDSQILVGIIDSGWSQIPEIQSKVAESWYYSSEGADAYDTDGHGTFVASIIAAQNDDGYGLAGYCGACRIIPFRVLNLTSFEVAAAIDKLVAEHVRIINLSISGGPTFIELDAVNYAISQNVLLVASSGNDSASQVGYPAAWLMGNNGALGWGLAVGASGSDDQRSFFSNWGSRLSLVAPGYGSSCADAILGAIPPIASDFDAPGCGLAVDLGNGGRYAYASGTSFSAPEVAGVAALVMAARPELSNAQVASVIEQTATRPVGAGWQPDVGWGVLNAAGALEFATGRSSSDTVHMDKPRVNGTRRAGSTDTAVADLTWGDGVAVSSGTADCDVAIAGRAVSASSSLKHGTAMCVWRVPVNGAGKIGTGSLTATDEEGNQASKPFAFKLLAKAAKKPRHK